MGSPALVVAAGRFSTMAAVDETEREGCAPERGDLGGVPDDGDHSVFELRRLDGPPKERKRVHAPGDGVDDIVIVVLPTGLVLLRAPMVVDAEKNRTGTLRDVAQKDCRPAAIRADLEEGAQRCDDERRSTKSLPFVRRHEPLGRLVHLAAKR